ncbi:SRPBCC family protein [Arthrobacter burdickii]|uniref:SRPBCC family protein n=1 Tax=Arthrobacter burdickii TaxID=3035920 RepID=A0ABT8K0E5_9MICC|nr:SRPBCC family protein [Arthrobacter burdickii]MDN4610819.1 SRPBCC family protein [Arthrobacter burdickii]
MTTKVEETVVVNLPVTTVYNQWTQFEEFPHFMGGIKQITQLSDDRLEWVAEIGGIRRQWEARILEQVPDRKVSWAATEGATNAGTVSFEDLGGTTRVNLVLEYEPEGLVEKVGDKLNVVENQAKADLQKFKTFIESESYSTGAWRGTVAGQPGTPTVEDAEQSRGDSGKAGVSGKVAAGVGLAAAATVAGVAAAAANKGKEEETETEVSTVPVTETAPVAPETSIPATTPVVSDTDIDAVPAVDGIPGTGVPSDSQGLQDDTLTDGDPINRRGTL